MMSKSRPQIVLVLAILLVLASCNASLAIFPKPDGPPFAGSVLSYNLNLGWLNDQQAWYLNLDGSTNDINLAARLGKPFFFFSKELSSALTPRLMGGDIAARPMYIVINPPASQGPIFTAAPGDPLYSGLWQIHYITWHANAARRPITNADPYPTPRGLPSPGEADIVATNIVVQYPIAAVGVLGGPWLPGPPDTYRMPQIVADPCYAQTKLVYLPTYVVFCTDPVTKKTCRNVITITDVSDEELVGLIGANLAPGLLNVPDEDTQAFWSIIGGPYNCQFPLLEQCPDGYGARQQNDLWTPIVRLTYLNRVALPLTTVINNKYYLQHLVGTGHLSLLRDDQRMGILFYNQMTMPAVQPGGRVSAGRR